MQPSPFSRVKKPLKSDMNVVPYIDVLLVLLVIFMIAAPIISSGITVDLPKAAADAVTPEQQQVAIISINPNKQYFLRFGSGVDTPMNLSDIQTMLAEEQAKAISNQQQLMVLVNGDQSIPYGQVISVMSELQQAGLEQVSLLTQAPNAIGNSDLSATDAPSAESLMGDLPATNP